MKIAPTQVFPASAPVRVAPKDRPARPTRQWRRRSGQIGFWTLVVVLGGLNLARLYDRLRPPPERPAIQRLIERNQVAQAEAALRDRLGRREFDGEARWMLASLLLGRGDLAGSAAEFRLVPPWWPTKREALVREGQSALGAGLAVQAEAAWRACLADDPLHPTPPRLFSTAANALLDLLTLEGRQDEAIALLWTIRDGSATEDRETVLATIMDLRLQGTRFPTDPRSIATLQQHVATDPGDTAARWALANAALQAGDSAGATRWVLDGVTAHPRDPAACRDLLAILHAQGDRARFDDEADRLPRGPVDPADARLAVVLGQVCESKGDPAGAIAAYRRAIALRPDDDKLLDHLAGLDAARGPTSSATDLQNRAAAIREARLALPKAYRAYRERVDHPTKADLAPHRAHLGELATTLGWTREAAAWNQSVTGTTAPGKLESSNPNP